MTMPRARATAGTMEADRAETADAEATNGEAANGEATDGEVAAEEQGPESAPGYGSGLDVESVLAEHAEAHPEALIEAQGIKPDADQEVDTDTIETKNDGDKIVATSKRGDFVIYVAKDADGVYYKGVVDAESGKPPAPEEVAEAAEDADKPDESAAAAAKAAKASQSDE